jgi:hypothetical protein
MKRNSKAFVCCLDVQSVNDMEKLQVIKDSIRTTNQVASISRKLRVVIRGRKPFVKMLISGGHYYSGSTRPVSYDRFGNIVGGIANASMIDVYLYDRCSY